MNKNALKHPSQGKLSISRINGRKRLFGTSFELDNWLAIRLQGCEVTNNYGHDHYFGSTELVEVYISPAQFADLITSFNTSGVPCTIKWLQGKVEQIDYEAEERKPETAKAIDEVMASGKRLSEKLDAVDKTIAELVSSKKISQKVANEILSSLGMAKQDLRSNIPFYLKQVDEAAEKVVTERKREVESAVAMRIEKAGIAAIQKEILSIEVKE